MGAEHAGEGVAARERMKPWRRARLSSRRAAWWLVLFLLALGSRFALLGERPPHHDEAIHGHFAWELLQRGSYRYDPTYHGPLQYFVLAGLFALFGAADSVLRSYAAACGVGLVLAPWLFRRVWGERAALGMGTLLLVSPSFLYFSRFARNDVPVVLFTSLALILLCRARRVATIPWVWVALFLGLHAVSKETIYVYGALWAASLGGVGLWVGLGSAKQWVGRFWQQQWKGVLWATAVFLALCLAFYTAFFSWPQDVWFPAKAISYWYGQHKVERVGGPWYYHLPRLGLYEFLILGLAAAGLWRRRRRLRVAERFLLLWGLTSLGMYAYLGEKVPWLSLHQLLPWVPLAGNQLAYLFSRAGHWLGKGLSVLGAAGTAWSALACSFLYPTIELDKPQAELLVFVQTTERAQQLAQEGWSLYRQNPQRVFAAVEGEGVWPLSWQWKGLPVHWGLPKGDSWPPLVVADPGKLPDPPGRGAWECETVPLRAWWVERWQGVGLRQLARWFFTRQAWSERGATQVEVCHSGEVKL